MPVDDLAEVVKGGKFHPTVQRRLEQASEGPANGPDTPACKAEAAYREQVRAAVLKTMDALKLDAFVYPDVEQSAAADRRPEHAGRRQQPVLLADDGLPGGAGADGLHARRPAAGRHHVLRPAVERGDADRLAYAYEQATRHRRPPPTAPPLR